MKIFLFNLLKYACIPIVIVLLYIVVLSFRKEQDEIYTEKRFLFEKLKSKTECIITGNSHTLRGLNPSLFKLYTINIAESNKPIGIDIEVIIKNLPRLKKLKYVIIPLDYFTFYFDGYKDESIYKFYHHWNLQQKRDKIKSFHIGTCGLRWNEKLNNNFKFDSINRGWEASAEVWDFKHLNYEKEIKGRINNWEEKWMDSNSVNNISSLLLQSIDRLKDRDINVLFVKMPVSQKIIDLYSPSVIKRNVEVEKLLEKKSNVRIMNLQNMSGFERQDRYYDADHLNVKGSEIASQLVNMALE